MDKEKQKKILKFIKSNVFCNGFLILCSLIGIGISLQGEINAHSLLGFPIAFTIGINGLIFIPMICDKKLMDLEDNKLNKEEITENRDIQLEITKKTNNNKELINIMDNIMLASPYIGIKLELLPEWQEYLENTFLDPKGIKIIQELIYYLMLIDKLSLEEVLSLVKEREDLLDILIHFSKKGEDLAKILNKEVKDIKRERTI